MSKNALITLVMLASMIPNGSVADQDLGAALTTRYHDQILALRHPFKAHSQDYDSQGNPLVNGSEGPWTLYGRMEVKQVTIDADRLRLEGDQVVFESDGKNEPLKPVRQKERVKVTIRLDHALAAEDEALAVIGRVFALTPEDVVSSAPPLWRHYLAQQLRVSQDGKRARKKPAIETGRATRERRSLTLANPWGKSQLSRLAQRVRRHSRSTSPSLCIAISRGNITSRAW